MPKSKNKSKDDTDGDKQGKSIVTEAEMRRQQEINKVMYKQKQSKEERYAHINNIKINSQWRKIKRMTKVEDLKRTIEICAQNHEREVDRKDAIIQMLDRDLDDGEDQYLMALRGHEEIVKKLFDMQKAENVQRQKAFEQQVKLLKTKFEEEKHGILKKHEENMGEMKRMISVMESEHNEAETDSKQEFEAQREEIKNRNSEEYNVLKIQLEANVEELERQFEQAHKNYINGTEHRSRAFEKLTNNDSSASRIIEIKMKKLKKLQDGLSFWRQKIVTTMNNWEERNQLLKYEKEMMSKHYRALKASMAKFHDTQIQKLKHLSIHSRKAENDLTDKLSMAESILKLWKMCQAYETEKEHLFHFFLHEDELSDEDKNADLDPTTPSDNDHEQKGVRYDDSLFKTKTYNEARASLTSTVMAPDGNEVEEWNYLQNYFKKFNSVLMSKSAIEKEKERLQEENSKLQSILKNYLNGISVNSKVLDDPFNSLLIVNNRLQNKIATKTK